MTGQVEDPRAYMIRISAARLGCAQCGGAVRVPPAGDPFSGGPFRGRYWCAECWCLYWDEHPEHLADEESRQYVREEAVQIRLKRGAEILFEEGPSRVYLSKKGTLLFDIRSAVELTPNEFDADRFKTFMKAAHAIAGRVPGFELDCA